MARPGRVVAAWWACGLAWLLGLGTITLAIIGRVPLRQFLEGYIVLGPLFGMPPRCWALGSSRGKQATESGGSCSAWA